MGVPTTLKIGYWRATDDSFQPHPNSPTDAVYDLNDGTTWVLEDSGQGFGEGLNLGNPRPTVYKSQNPRVTGERVVRRIYNSNRTVSIHLFAGPFTNYTSFITSVRQLVQLCEGISPTTPAAIQIQPTGSSTPVYAECYSITHSVPYKETLWLQLLEDGITLECECAPFFRGTRQTLSNLQMNPGCEAPTGGGIATEYPTVFGDNFTNINPYTTISGSPTVGSNELSLPANASVTFGSPAWSAVQTWTVRWAAATGGTASFYLHYADANDYTRLDIGTTSYTLYQVVASVSHTVTTGSTTTPNNTFYWVSLTQYPTVPGEPPMVAFTIFADSAGTVGSAITTVSPVQMYAYATGGVSGVMGFLAQGATVNFGNIAGTSNTVDLFGPGAWAFATAGTGAAAGAWDGTRLEVGMSGTATAGTQTFGGGPVTSTGAARIDCAPAGTVNASWFVYNGGSGQLTRAIPVSAVGDVLQAVAWVKSSGLSVSATLSLILRVYNSSGTFLSQTTVASLTGNQAAWTQLAGSLTTPASTAYASLLVNVSDSTSGSVGATVWIDNTQCWDQTATSMAAMPYCELRFPQSPAQLMVSGLLGDVPAYAQVQLGHYLSSWANGGTINTWLGRRAQSTAGLVMLGPSVGWYGGNVTSPPLANATPVLDSASYGGFYLKNTSSSTISWTPRFISPLASDAVGKFHLLGRTYTVNASPTTLQFNSDIQQRQQTWFGLSSSTNADLLGEFFGSAILPLSAQNTWTTIDVGLIFLPPFTAAYNANGSQTYILPMVTGYGINEQDRWGWQAILPVDGERYVASTTNASGSTISTSWIYNYWDARSTATTYSVETVQLPNVGHSGGGNVTPVAIAPTADTLPRVDPTTRISGTSVNQWLLHANDGNNALLPVVVDISYSPQYLQPL